MTTHRAHAPSPHRPAMGREPSSLRPGQLAASGPGFLASVPVASVAVLAALRFALARGLLAPLVTALSYCAGGATKVPVLVALLLYALTWATFLACQLYCADTHGLLDNRNRRALFATWTAGLGARCWSAHLNANEALAAYGPAAAAAAALGAPAMPAATLAAAVVAARVAHAAFYAAAMDVPRSVAYAFGAQCTAALYALCLWPAATVKLFRLL